MQIINIIIVGFLICFFSSCSRTQLNKDLEKELLEDLFTKIYENCLKETEKGYEDILVYKYLTRADTLSTIDTMTLKRRKIPPIEFNMGSKNVILISDFLNETRNKFRTIYPDKGVIISDINYLTQEKIYFIVITFTSSLGFSEFRFNYEIKGGKPLFISYELLSYG